MVFRSFRTRLSLYILAILIVSLSITALLNYFNFQSSYFAARKSNFRVIGEDVRGTIEFGLNMGVPLASLKNIQEILKNTRDRVPEIEAIVVSSMKGERLFQSCDNDSVLNKIDDWFVKKDTIALIRENALVFELHNAFHKTSGYLLMWYRDDANKNPVTEMGVALLIILGSLIGGSVVILFVGVPIIFSRLSMQIRKLQVSLDATESDVVEEQVRAFKQTTEEALERLQAIEGSRGKDES